MDKKIKRLLQVILVFIIIYFSTRIFIYLNNSKKVDAQHLELKDELENIETNIVSKNSSNKVEEKEEQIDQDKLEVEKLRQLNNKYNNIVGWIKIPNTSIDYPIVQGTNNEFYLDHDYKENYNVFGAIYLEKDNDKNFKDQNTIIYGHRANTHQMFYDLLKYQDKDFINENNKVIITTLDEVMEYEIFASYEADPYEDFRSVEYNDKDLELLKNRIDKKNILDLEIPESLDDMLTLQTCLVNDNRLVIHSVRVK